MAIKTTYPMTNSANYTFDPSEIEFVGGISKLIAVISGSAAKAYWKIDEGVGEVARDATENKIDGAIRGGWDNNWSTAGKFGAGIEGDGAGWLDMGNTQIDFERIDAFSVECWIKFTSASTQSVVGKLNNSPINGYEINIASSQFRWVIRDLSGNIITIQSNNTYNDGVLHHVVATYDGGSLYTGMKLYIDDILNFTATNTDTLTDTIQNNIDFRISGRQGNTNFLVSNTVISDVVVYDRELTAAEVTFRWNGGAGTQIIPGASTSFPTDNPILTTKGTIFTTELVDFDSTITATGLDDILYTIVANGVEKYWDSSAWVDSTGYPEVNTAADIKTNIATLLLTGISAVKLNRYFHSDDGSTTPELDVDSIDYEYIPEAVNLQFATVNGTIFDFDGDPTDVTITVQTVRKIVGSSTTITSNPIPVIYDSITGNWTVDLFYEDVEPIELKWLFNTETIITNFLAGINNFNDLTVV